ncbi:MAG: ATP-binding cassette domain-containing protein [Clostridiales bacterium]|nr:ATP-binding cassette domain-containing protein [Clostridiales bacterium]
MEYVLKVEGLTKKYKSHPAVNNAYMSIRRGDIYGFVGENGSGKTTLIRLISGLIFENGGSFELFGVKNNSKDIYGARKKIGAIVETPSIYLNMSAYDSLKMQATILGINDEEKIKGVLCDVGLGELLNNKKHVGDFSLGMRQRLGIAMTLLGDPEFLILDEPMNGLDPAGIVEIRELILKLNRERGITFLISSHILTELTLVATKYGIISKGTIIKEITSEELHRECTKTTSIQSNDSSRLMEVLSSILPADMLSYIPEGVKISGEIDLNSVLGTLITSEVTLTSVNCSETSFEEYYLSIVGGAK